MKFVVSEKKAPTGLLLVVTDKDILGTIVEEGKLQLDLTKEFYNGTEKSEKEVRGLIKEATHLHLTGQATIAIAVELDVIEADRILWVQSVPHAQVVCGV